MPVAAGQGNVAGDLLAWQMIARQRSVYLESNRDRAFSDLDGVAAWQRSAFPQLVAATLPAPTRLAEVLRVKATHETDTAGKRGSRQYFCSL